VKICNAPSTFVGLTNVGLPKRFVTEGPLA
jgi:hypothetical protein